MRELQSMSKATRHLTPVALAIKLCQVVREMTGARRIAILYCDIAGPYMGIPDVEVYPLWAESYCGPYPIIAHPACGPWGKLKWRCKHQNRRDGIRAMALVHRHGGIVEQPLGSSLFREFGLPGGAIARVNQSDYGHEALKPTLLYNYKP